MRGAKCIQGGRPDVRLKRVLQREVRTRARPLSSLPEFLGTSTQRFLWEAHMASRVSRYRYCVGHDCDRASLVVLRKFYLVREVFVFVAFTAFLVFFVASLVVLGIVVQSAGRTVLPASREHDRELLRRAHFVGSSSPARFFHEAHVNVRTDLRLSFALSSSPSC